MKTFSMLSLTLGIVLVTASCNNEPSPRATPIDSTNDYGKAPVEYNGSTETSKTDTTMHSQPMDQKARQDYNANATIGAGSSTTTTPTANTTDSSTTSGSVNPKKK